MPVQLQSYWDKGITMETVFVVSLVIFTIIIAAAALGLIRVILHLRAVVKTLDALDGGVAVIVAFVVATTSAQPTAAAIVYVTV